jgi:hypothetical protein
VKQPTKKIPAITHRIYFPHVPKLLRILVIDIGAKSSEPSSAFADYST